MDRRPSDEPRFRFCSHSSRAGRRFRLESAVSCPLVCQHQSIAPCATRVRALPCSPARHAAQPQRSQELSPPSASAIPDHPAPLPLNRLFRSRNTLLRRFFARFSHKTLVHRLARQVMQHLLVAFRAALSRTQKLTGRAKPLQPHFVFRTKLLLEFLAKSLCQRGTFSVRRNRNLQIAAL